MKYSIFFVAIFLILSCKSESKKSTNSESSYTELEKSIIERSKPIVTSINDLDVDAELKDFLKQVKNKYESHDWKGLQLICDPLNYGLQMDHGMGEAQFFAELFGLNYKNNSIANGESITFKHLALINKMKLHSVEQNGEINTVKGTVALTDKRILNIEFMVEKIDDEYLLVGASG